MAEKIFSEIPMRTWHWLGVNEAGIEENVLLNPVKNTLEVSANSENDLTVVYKEDNYGDISIKVGENSCLKLTQVQLLPVEKDHANEVTVILSKGAHLEMAVVEAGAKKTVSKVKVVLEGNNSKADVSVLYFGDEKRHIDLNYVMEQKGRNTEANLNVYGALMDECRKVCRGTLDFQRGSKGSKGYEKEQVTVLSGKVRNSSIPIMLSGEDDVDGHHAVSIGKIDEEKMFYLMSRGLDLKESRRLIVEAAFNPVLDKIASEELRDEIDSYIKGRLGKNE